MSPETSLKLIKTFVSRWAVRWFAALRTHHPSSIPLQIPVQFLPDAAPITASLPTGWRWYFSEGHHVYSSSCCHRSRRVAIDR